MTVVGGFSACIAAPQCLQALEREQLLKRRGCAGALWASGFHVLTNPRQQFPLLEEIFNSLLSLEGAAALLLFLRASKLHAGAGAATALPAIAAACKQRPARTAELLYFRHFGGS